MENLNPDDINHCWTEYKNYIIDITATQFHIKERVYICNKKDNKYYYPIQKNEKFGYTWGDQNPFEYTKKINRLVSTAVKELEKENRLKPKKNKD